MDRFSKAQDTDTDSVTDDDDWQLEPSTTQAQTLPHECAESKDSTDTRPPPQQPQPVAATRVLLFQQELPTTDLPFLCLPEHDPVPATARSSSEQILDEEARQLLEDLDQHFASFSAQLGQTDSVPSRATALTSAVNVDEQMQSVQTINIASSQIPTSPRTFFSKTRAQLADFRSRVSSPRGDIFSPLRRSARLQNKSN
jgi:hypothetical protein